MLLANGGNEVSEGILAAGGNIPLTMIGFLALLAIICALCVYIAILKQHLIEEHERLEQLEKRVCEQNQANEVKQKFLFNMSHDIRTPMNAILGFANLAQRQMANDESADESLRYIEEAGNNLMELLDGVLDTASLESDKVCIQESRGNLEQTMERYLQMVKAQAKESGISFTSKYELEHSELYFDGRVLNKVMLNLVSNALKYTNDGGEISVLVKELPGEATDLSHIDIEITDTGIGISDSFKPHLFEPFAREKNTTMSGVGGTGLGLSIAKRLVELMGGTIELDSTQGVGTKVVLHLVFRIPEGFALDTESNMEPAPEAKSFDHVHALSEEDAIRATKTSLNKTIYTVSAAINSGISDDAVEAAAAIPRKTLTADDYSFVNRRVLLVEDNKVNQKMEQMVLERAGITVEIADDGVIAVEMVRTAPAKYYDAVLMDLQMPNMDGFEATTAIRALEDPEQASVPIIAVTANTSEADRLLSQEVGMNGHLGKPIKILELLEVLQEYFEEI